MEDLNLVYFGGRGGEGRGGEGRGGEGRGGGGGDVNLIYLSKSI